MDNLRYISLQYIKGDNYEKIQCFKYEEIMELLAYIKMSGDYSPEILKNLKDMKEKDKCPVGESFLNDLVSYYNFKDIRDAIDEIANDAKEDDLAFTNKKELKGIFNSNQNYDKNNLTEIFNKIEKKSVNREKKELYEAKKDVNVLKKDVNVLKKELDEAKKELEDAYLKAGINTLIASAPYPYTRTNRYTSTSFNKINVAEAATKSIKSIDSLKSNLLEAEKRLDKAVINAIKEVAIEIDNIKKKTERDLKDLDSKDEKELKEAIRKSKNVYKAIEEIEGIIPAIKKDKKKDKKNVKESGVKTDKEELIDNIFNNINNTDDIINNIKNKIDEDKDENKKLITILKEVFNYDSEREIVMALLKIYRKICDRNIDKFGNLFTKTDISSIDDAFMIKSYAVFLDKFEKIKKSLEGKDLTKLERGLSNSLERLFDLYGINDPDTLLKGEDTKYLYEHIVQ